MKAVIGTLAVSLVVALVAGVWVIQSGVFNVSTTWRDPGLWHWILATTRERSVQRRSTGIAIPDLAGNAMIARGFRSYRDMCAGCHGAPGKAPSHLAQGLNPPPPDLSDPEYNESAGQVFWVVKHGIRMTGMPGWGASHSDEALWDVVAFVRTLPGMTAGHYRALESSLPAGHEHSHSHGHGVHAGNDAPDTATGEHHTH